LPSNQHEHQLLLQYANARLISFSCSAGARVVCRLEVPPHLVQLLAQVWSSSCKASTGNLARVTGTRSGLSLLHSFLDCLSICLMGGIFVPQTLQQLCHMAVYIGHGECLQYITIHVPACNHTRCTLLLSLGTQYCAPVRQHDVHHCCDQAKSGLCHALLGWLSCCVASCRH